MAFVIDNPNHPCVGKSCNDCETCIFDIDIDEIQPKPKTSSMPSQCGQLTKCYTGTHCENCEFNEETNKDKTMINETCNKCQQLIKNYIDDEKLLFNACCGKVIIDYTTYTRPRVIRYKTGHMLDIHTPDWCPKKRGIDKQVLKPSFNGAYSDEDEVVSPPPLPNQATKQSLTYYEKREKLKMLPKHLTWEEIKENEVYVIPRILSQARKIIKVVLKTDNILRTVEINEHGKESTYFSTIYPNDIETVFITKIHKY